MNLSEALRDPKQRIMAGVAGVALLLAAVVGIRAVFSSGAPKQDATINTAVQAAQQNTPEPVATGEKGAEEEAPEVLPRGGAKRIRKESGGE